MNHVDTIIFNVGELVTCAAGGKPKRRAEMADVGIIANGAVAIADGKFAAVGTTEEILQEFAAENVIDVEGKVICPGFVDPHTHIVYAGDRLNEFELKIKGADYLDILASGGGILSTVKATRAASFEHLVKLGLKLLDKMFVCGTTTAEIKTGYGLDTATELKMLDVIAELDKRHVIDIVPTFLAAHTVPNEFKDNADGYVDLVCAEMLPRAWDWYRRSHFWGLVPFFADVFTEQKSFNVDQSRRILESARTMGFRIKAHVDQFTNLGGSRLAIGCGATSIDHLDAISDEEIAILAASDTVGIVIPTENFNAGKTQFANARKMIDAGCAMALSTDYNPGSAPCPSQPMAMAIACRYQKLLPAEALNAATINAAFAIGLGEQCGSIEKGKKADLLILDMNDHRQIVAEFGGNGVKTVFKRGEVV
ncbi:MAG: imidazolonepropionase [Acidobacteria bacterium]|nr:imidazolonepropionase [Acidobacteriota bacterium]MBK7935358.1 imidazolonepropionase [Acidobacteriota bacterium]